MNHRLSGAEKLYQFFFIVGISLFFHFSISQASEKGNPVLIPSGEFFMGTEDGTESELPIHKVYLKAFKIDRYEVTNLQFETFDLDHTRSAASACDQCPVTLVTWVEANNYCKHQGGRLPTEEEWERAARGPEEFSYSFGQKGDISKANYGNEFNAGAKPVHSFQPNGFGLYNMSGNVWEWVHNWFSFYPQPSAPAVRDNKKSGEKLLRGGSWYNKAYYVHAGMRFTLKPGTRLNSVGFRCAREAG